MSICRFCGCDPSKDLLSEAIRKIQGCNNCRVDIMLKGDHTGAGWQAIKDLVKLHGREEVAQEWERG